MRRLPAFALALALGATSAVGLVACGGEDAKLLPGSTALEITENLDTVEQLADEGECLGAAEAAEEVSLQVESIEGVDPQLKLALEQGVGRLGEVVTTCEETTTEAIEPDTGETTAERTESPELEKEREKAEKEAEKEAKALEKEEERAEKEKESVPPGPPTTPAEPPTTPPSSEDGGTGAPGGVTPGAPVESDDEGDD